MTKATWILLTAGCIGVWAIAACEPGEPAGRESQVPPPARHAVQSEELHDIMSRVGAEVRETWPQEIARLKARQAREQAPERFEEIATTAGELANDAHAIPQAVPQTELAGPDREEFMRLVSQLESSARSLQNAAARQNQRGVQASLDRVRDTCKDCHRQFRAVAGPLRFGF